MYYQTDAEALAERIRQSMREHKTNIGKVAEKAKLTRPTAYRYVKYPNKAPLGSLMKIAYYSGVQQITLKTGAFIVG